MAVPGSKTGSNPGDPHVQMNAWREGRAPRQNTTPLPDVTIAAEIRVVNNDADSARSSLSARELSGEHGLAGSGALRPRRWPVGPHTATCSSSRFAGGLQALGGGVLLLPVFTSCRTVPGRCGDGSGEPVLVGVGDGLGSVADAGLGEEMIDMALYCGLADY
jgi:hypothetical protein